MQFLDGVKRQGEIIPSVLNGKSLTITLNYQNVHYKEMLALIQLLKNHDCIYKLKASECDYMVTKVVLNDDGSERVCSKLKYVNQAIENGKKINIISFDELLGILKVTEYQLSQMPFPDESSFLKKEKERKLKKDKIRYSSEEDITTTIGDILKAKGITI